MEILFWNLKQNDNSPLIADCLESLDIDIAVFAEHSGVDFNALENTLTHYRYEEGNQGCEKIKFLFKRETSYTIRTEQTRYSIGILQHESEEFIFASTHLQDKWTSDSATRIDTIGQMMRSIRGLESASRLDKTIIIGDFNSNPYDRELLQPNSFNAVLFKELIREQEHREWNGTKYRKMYNPILNWISEDTLMHGSYYYGNGPDTPYWNCLDQILVSRPLIDRINSVRYLRKIGTTELIAKIKPRNGISDHLPLVVSIS